MKLKEKIKEIENYPFFGMLVGVICYNITLVLFLLIIILWHLTMDLINNHLEKILLIIFISPCPLLGGYVMGMAMNPQMKKDKQDFMIGFLLGIYLITFPHIPEAIQWWINQ